MNSAQSSSDSPMHTRPKVLVVDDQTVVRESLKSIILMHANVSIEEASSGHDCLQILEGQKFDLVITDLNMPQGDGKWVVDQMKSRFPNIPIIVFTSDQYATRSEFGDPPALLGVIHKSNFRDLLTEIQKLKGDPHG